jgi:hypothetical protein
MGTNTFFPLFNTVKPQIGWKWVNKERKIRTWTDKEFKKFEGMITNMNFFWGPIWNFSRTKRIIPSIFSLPEILL